MFKVYRKLTKRQWWLLAVGIVAGLGLGLAAILLSVPIRSETLKERVVALLSEELESEVTIETLQGRILPRVAVSGTGVVIRQRGRTDVPPLIAIEGFEIRGSFRDLMSAPRRVAEVRLRGLRVSVPPGRDRTGDDGSHADAQPEPGPSSAAGRLQRVVIERFEAPDTVITLIPGKPGKRAKVFTVHHLVMESLGINQTIPYIATLTNPVPKGEIETSGTFGPWNVSNPEATPLRGKYTFVNANLDTINGLAGTLSSAGEFRGPVNRIVVEGTTETPDFQVDAGGLPVPLNTRFTAVVDGSDGDTYLRQVHATFLETSLTAQGAVIGLEGVNGRQVEVHVAIEDGRMEDLLRLTVASEQPILTGAVRLNARLVVPPDPAKKVMERLSLRGEFALSKAVFSDTTVQTKLVGLSRRGRGLKAEEAPGDVASNLRARFAVENAAARFSSLSFSVPGATVSLAGRYGLRDETIDFRGRLLMKATLSQVVGGGVKGFFLKVFDPFFRDGKSGMAVPIKISGTRNAPKFGLDMF